MVSDRIKKTVVVASLVLCVIILVVSAAVILGLEESGCVVYLDRDFVLEHPLVLKSNRFVLPDEDRTLKFKSGEEVLLSCAGDGNYFLYGKPEKDKTVKCVKKDVFYSPSDGSFLPFRLLRCNVYPRSTTRLTEHKCLLTHTEIEIGFQVSSGFVGLMKTCFKSDTKDSLYSSFVMSKNINARQTKLPKVDFEDDGFYKVKNIEPPDVLYNRNSQKYMIKKLLHTTTSVEKYINLTNYLNRGHLTAKADYIYHSQQSATFHYINVAPQWKLFNQGNWARLEDDIRDFVSARKQDYVIYTGVWDTLTLDSTAVYLYVNEKERLLSVPKIFWKILYDPKSYTAVGFVGHNDPIQATPICNTICSEITGFKFSWDATNFTKGYSYCCKYEDLKSTVKYLPELNVTGLLS